MIAFKQLDSQPAPSEGSRGADVAPGENEFDTPAVDEDFSIKDCLSC